MEWRIRLRALTMLLVLLPLDAARGGGGPQNVALIVNPNDPDSLAIANYYVELRNIPPANVIYVPWRAELHGATGVQFREQLLKPTLKQLKDRGIAPQIDYLAFSSGFPYLIDCAPLFRDRQFPPQARPATSLTSAAYFYQFILDGRPEMFDMSANDYFAPTTNGTTVSRAFPFSDSATANPGEAAAAVDKKFLLSTSIAITLGHGNSGGEITSYLRRAKQADGTKPRGTIFYMQNNDVRSKVRAGEYPAAVRELAAVGVAAVVLPGVVPMNKPDVAGLTTGAPHVNLKASGSTLLPGALVDNLTSAGGQMLIRQEGNPQTRISEYLRLGAAGASGAVVEPFAIPQKFPSPALHVHYARGCSLAEAYYQSVAAPYHLLIIGDPLCQPWAVAPKVDVGLQATGSLSGRVTLAPQATYNDARKAERFELYVDGVRQRTAAPGTAIEIDTKLLADGWHELRVVAVDDTPIEVQGVATATVEVKNGDGKLEIKNDEPIKAALAGSIRVDVQSTSATETAILQNGRRLAAVADGSGTAEFPASMLGKGRTTLHAEQAGRTSLRSQSVSVEVQ